MLVFDLSVNDGITGDEKTAEPGFQSFNLDVYGEKLLLFYSI